MSTLRKMADEDGTFSVHSAGQVIRGSLTTDEADDVIAMLAPMEVDED